MVSNSTFFVVTMLVGSVAAALCFQFPDVGRTSQTMIAESGFELKAIPDSLRSLPREIADAGHQIGSAWEQFSARVASEAGILKHQIEYETKRHS